MGGGTYEDVVMVDKAVTLGETKSTKTNQNRTLGVLAPLADDIAKSRKSLGAIPGQGSFVFPHPLDASRRWGDTTYQNWRSRTFDAAVALAGLSVVMPYTLRHSFISLLLAAGRRRHAVNE